MRTYSGIELEADALRATLDQLRAGLNRPPAWRVSLLVGAALLGGSGIGCAPALGARAGACGCDASNAGSDQHLGCGESACVGGAPFHCTPEADLVRDPGTCGGPPPNPRPSDAPDLVFVAVSGHCFPGCSFNSEYLTSQGTTQVLANAFSGLGVTVGSVSTTDNFYDYPPGSSAPQALGFLTLLATLEQLRDEWIADFDNPTRVIVVAHSHGAVWAHLALHVLEQEGNPLPVDVLIDIDGISISWENDTGTAFIGDEWASVIEQYDASTGTTWPFPIDHPTDAFTIPGLADPQDIEDIVPDSALVNLEIWSDDGLGVRDTQHNHRLDGSEDNIGWFQSTVNHETSDEPGSDGVAWAVEELRLVYGL